MSNHSFVIFSVSVCETEASYSLPEFIFSSLYLIPFLTVSVNLLLHKPFPYSGIFNIILILSSSTLKKNKGKKILSITLYRKLVLKRVAYWNEVIIHPVISTQKTMTLCFICLYISFFRNLLRISHMS